MLTMPENEFHQVSEIHFSKSPATLPNVISFHQNMLILESRSEEKNQNFITRGEQYAFPCLHSEKQVK